MAFTNERDKKGRLSFVYNSEEAEEAIREIVEECQKKVVGVHAARFLLTARARQLVPGSTHPRAEKTPNFGAPLEHARRLPCLKLLSTLLVPYHSSNEGRQQRAAAAIQICLPGVDRRESLADGPQRVSLPVGFRD